MKTGPRNLSCQWKVSDEGTAADFFNNISFYMNCVYGQKCFRELWLRPSVNSVKAQFSELK